MRTETKTTKIYQFHELSDTARDRATESFRCNQEYFHADDNRASLTKFEGMFPVKVINYEYGGCPCWIQSELTGEDELMEISGIRLLAHLQTNYHNDLFTGKFYWKGTANGASRSSNVIKEANNCPLTGFHMDCVLLDPIYKFIEKPDNSITFGELIKDCLDQWVEACSNDYNSTFEDEYIQENIEANEYEFTEDGIQY